MLGDGTLAGLGMDEFRFHAAVRPGASYDVVRIGAAKAQKGKKVKAGDIAAGVIYEAHVRGLERFLKSGEGPMLNSRIEITALHRDGREFPIELAVTPIVL